MKKAMIVVLALLLMVGVASAQVQLGVGGGISKALGDGSEYWKLGFNGRVTAFKAMGENLDVGVMGAYNMFSMDTDGLLEDMDADMAGVDVESDVSLSIIEIIAAARYFMSPQFFVQGGGGLYIMNAKGDFTISGMGQTYSEEMDESESKPGVSLGAGFNMGNIGVAAFYNIVFTEDESTKYFTVNAMIGL